MSRMPSLSRQLLKSVLSIYFIITLTVTLVQMGIEYVHTRDTISAELKSTERTFYPALATALWELNSEQLQAITRGVVGLPIISSVRVVDASHRVLADMSKPGVPRMSISHTFRVTYRYSGMDVHLADVTFVTASDVVFNRVALGYQMIIVSALIKSTALALLFFWVFRRQLGQPLRQLTEALSLVDLDSLARQKVDFRQRDDNELSRLERAFNRMLTRLDDERHAHEAKLLEMNRNLEKLVAERTNELSLANSYLEQLVRTDALTGAANRRHFVERICTEIQRVRRTKAPLSLLMLDLDHFKRINDRYGHGVGDEVLLNFADVVSSVLRAGDLFARLGGEEFAVLLPDAPLEGAAEVAERILEATKEQALRCNGAQIHYGVSIGAACFRPEDNSYEALLKRADEALYQAKRAGRGRIETA